MIHYNLKDNFFVYLQFCLFIIFLFDIEFGQINLYTALKYGGLAFFTFGVLICIISIVQLKRNLTPFPTPKESAKLYQEGLYKYIRHPIYTGLMMIFIGASIFLGSLFKLGVAFLLMILFYYKSSYEEKQLLKKFKAYQQYQLYTGRFLPRWF